MLILVFAIAAAATVQEVQPFHHSFFRFPSICFLPCGIGSLRTAVGYEADMRCLELYLLRSTEFTRIIYIIYILGKYFDNSFRMRPGIGAASRYSTGSAVVNLTAKRRK